MLCCAQTALALLPPCASRKIPTICSSLCRFFFICFVLCTGQNYILIPSSFPGSGHIHFVINGTEKRVNAFSFLLRPQLTFHLELPSNRQPGRKSCKKTPYNSSKKCCPYFHTGKFTAASSYCQPKTDYGPLKQRRGRHRC